MGMGSPGIIFVIRFNHTKKLFLTDWVFMVKKVLTPATDKEKPPFVNFEQSPHIG